MGIVRKLLSAVLGIGIPLAIFLAFVYAIIIRPADAPDVAALTEATLAPGAGGADLVGSPDGTWTLAEGWIGYRVVEHWARLHEPGEGVGRTEAVEADLVIEDLTLTELEAVADLTDLSSDRANRDDVIRVRYLESNAFPEADFVLTEPLPLQPAPGAVAEFTAAGVLEVRQISLPVTVEGEARWDGEELRVVGSAPVTLTDFGIELPDIIAFVKVEDLAAFEFDLTFTRS